MDWLTFIAQMTKALIWPIVILIIVFRFHEPLSKLLLGLTKVRWKELEVEFSERLSSAKKEAEALPSLPNAATLTLASSEPSSEELGLADISPRLAIIESWFKVESAAVQAASHHGKETGHSIQPMRIGQFLHECHIIDSHTLSVYNKLRELRNKAAHFQEFAISRDEAVDYIKTAHFLAAYIRAIVPPP